MNPNGTAPYATDDQLMAMASQRAQQDLAQRLGGIHLEHAEAGAKASVLREELLRLRGQVLDGLEVEVLRQGQIGRLQATVADLRQQLGLPPELEEEADELDAPPRTDHRYAAAHVAPHHRELAAEDHPIADAPGHEDDAHAHGATNARLLEAMEAERDRLGRDLTADEINAVHGDVLAGKGRQSGTAEAPGDGPLPLAEVNGRLA